MSKEWEDFEKAIEKKELFKNKKTIGIRMDEDLKTQLEDKHRQLKKAKVKISFEDFLILLALKGLNQGYNVNEDGELYMYPKHKTAQIEEHFKSKATTPRKRKRNKKEATE